MAGSQLYSEVVHSEDIGLRASDVCGQVPLKSPITPKELEGFEFAGGSMKPKIAAALEFVRATGRPCGIGDLHDALALVLGKAGTWIIADQ